MLPCAGARRLRLTADGLAHPGQPLELITVWRCRERVPPQAFDLRVFAHLLDAQSRVVAGEDRLDLNPPTWEPGDVLVQHHLLWVPEEVEPGTYQLEIGLYAAITNRRLSVLDGESSVSDRLLFQEIEVTRP